MIELTDVLLPSIVIFFDNALISQNVAWYQFMISRKVLHEEWYFKVMNQTSISKRTQYPVRTVVG